VSDLPTPADADVEADLDVGEVATSGVDEADLDEVDTDLGGDADLGDDADVEAFEEDDVDLEQDTDGAPGLPRWVPIAAFVLSLAGFGISLYLTVEHFQGGTLSCPATGIINCQKVTTSEWSKLFGIPVALLGLVFYTGLVVVNWPSLWRTRARWVAWVRLAMVISGVGFVLYLLAAELFLIKAICLWCTSVHVITFLLFVLIVSTFPVVSAAASDEQDPNEIEAGGP
jgi:uncharacterized membrane protein